jgi:hypothetical protein
VSHVFPSSGGSASVLSKDVAEAICAHIPCDACGYDLFRLEAGNPCPECGLRVSRSLGTDRLLFAPLNALRFGWWGTTSLLCGFAMSLIISPLVSGFLAIGLDRVSTLFMQAGVGLIGLSYFYVTGASWRLVGLACWLASIPAIIADFILLLEVGDASSITHSIVASSLMWTQCISFLMGLLFLRRLMIRASKRGIARLITCGGLAIICGNGVSIVRGKADFDNMVGICGLVSLLVGVVLVLCSSYLANRMFAHIIRARKLT